VELKSRLSICSVPDTVAYGALTKRTRVVGGPRVHRNVDSHLFEFINFIGQVRSRSTGGPKGHYPMPIQKQLFFDGRDQPKQGKTGSWLNAER
jgi:hypothetical protein